MLYESLFEDDWHNRPSLSKRHDDDDEIMFLIITRTVLVVCDSCISCVYCLFLYEIFSVVFISSNVDVATFLRYLGA